MNETDDIPSPAELAKLIKKDEEDKKTKIVEYAKAILKKAEVARIFKAKRYVLIEERKNVELEIAVDSKELSENEFNLTDLMSPIKDLLKGYDVQIKEKGDSLVISASVPKKHFETDEDEETK